MPERMNDDSDNAPGKLDVFKDWLPAIMVTGRSPLRDEQDWRTYQPFLINHALSMYRDLVLLANEMNLASHLPKAAQFKFYLASVRKFKRQWAPYHKATKDEDIQVVQRYYNYSHHKAEVALALLSPEQLSSIHKVYANMK